MTGLRRRLNTALLLAALALAAVVWRPAMAPADQDAPKDDGDRAAQEQRDDQGDRRDRGDDRRSRRGPDGRESRDGDGDGRGQRGPWQGPGGEPPKFPGTDEALDEAMAVFKDLNPYMAGRLEEERKKDPERAKRHIERMWPFLHGFIELKRNQPELYGYRAKEARTGMAARYFAFKYHHAKREKDDKAAAEAKAQLQKQSREHFEARMQIREYELTQLTEQIKGMQAKLADMRGEKEKHIQDQIDRLLNPPQRSPGPPRERNDER
jgi:hypothetical protein